MYDMDGPQVASHLYRQLFSADTKYLDPDVIPYALDEVTRRLREQGVPPARWATFIHLGV